MKRLYTLLALILAATIATALPVGQQTAMRVARQYAATHGMTQMASMPLVDIAPQLQKNGIECQHLHIFVPYGSQQSNGFVIVAGSDAVYPILAASSQHAFATTSLPQGVEAWLASTSAQIAAIERGNYNATVDITTMWQSLLHPAKGGDSCVGVSSIVSDEWSQDAPYNELCPVVGMMQTKTGCVATAMAQVMHHWKYPVHGMGSRSYTTTDYGTLSADFYNTRYNWNIMPQIGAVTNNEAQAVATLSYHCGISVKTSYGTSASSADVESIAGAMVSYFGYKPTARYVEKKNYSDSGWMAMLRNELDAGRPVIYIGCATNGCHCFICDGYSCDSTFSFNWGWSGLCNGSYRIGALNPIYSSTGGEDEYNTLNAAVIGIEPGDDELLLFATPESHITFDTGSTQELTISGFATTDSVYVRPILTSGEGWTATMTNSCEWLTLHTTSGTANGELTPLVFTARHNRSGHQREAVITITQGSVVKTLVIVQPDATPSPTGCFGTLASVGKNLNIDKGCELFIRPETLGIFTDGSTLHSLSFVTNPDATHPSTQFRINIYENNNYDTNDFKFYYTLTPENTIGQKVTSFEYTASGSGEQTVTFPYEYNISRKNFWVSIESLDSARIAYAEVSMANDVANTMLPYFDSLKATYLYTSHKAKAGGGYDTILNIAAFYNMTDIDRATQYEYQMAFSICIDRFDCTDSVQSDTVSLCMPYLWFDTILDESGDYERRLEGITIDGCDSVYYLNLSVNAPTSDTTTYYKCLSFTTDSATYTADTVIERHYLSAHQCDSAKHIYIYIGHPVTTNDTLYGCDSLVWRNKFTAYSTSDRGETYGSIFGAGCDTTAKVHIVVNKNSYGTHDTAACDYLFWAGAEYSTSNPHAEVRLRNAVGCDSILDVNLVIKHSSKGDTAANSCDSFIWYGTRYTTDGTPLHTLTNSVGCDSILKLTLTLRHTTYYDTVIYSCDSFVWEGQKYYTENSFITTLPGANSQQCDSVVFTTMLLNTFTFGDTLAHECDSFAWDGQRFTEPYNQAIGHRVNHNGCDSIVTLTLSLSYSTRSHEQAEACGYFMWHGYRVSQLNDDGEFGDTLVNSVGCDSIVVLHLTLNPLADGALPGVFEVAEGVKVNFAMGNLQYLASANLWRFAVRQYDYVGYDNSSISATYSSWVDLFGWGTTGYHASSDRYNTCYMPYSNTSKNINFDYNVKGYGPSINYICPDLDSLSSNYDWGMRHAISNGGEKAGMWHTLPAEQWDYILNYRDNALNKRAMATVNGTHGIVLLPECWIQPTSCTFQSGNNNGYQTNLYSPMQWNDMQDAGALFLPAAGARYDSVISAVGENGYYWTSTHNDQATAYVMLIEKKRTTVDAFDRAVGRSVRLAQHIDGSTIPCETYGDTTITAVDSLTWLGDTYYETGEYQRRLTNANTQHCDSIVVLHLTVVDKLGINNVKAGANVKVWGHNRTITVEGASQQRVRVYDVTGRVLFDDPASRQDTRSYRPSSAGAYIVKVGSHPAQRVIVK